MNLQGRLVLLTGASGGIGRAIACELADRGARLLLSGRDPHKLATLVDALQARGADARILPADLQYGEDLDRLARAALEIGVPDLLIHCAGRLGFGALETMSAQAITLLWQTNVIAPSLLSRALLPAMRQRGSGRIVFVGSIFGSLGFPLYASYSASKFALRGLAEALRRELDGSGVGITYVAPRYTRTDLNAGAPERLARELKMAQDEPRQVAARIVTAIERERSEVYFGFAERIFVRINAWWPRLVDLALRAQTRRMRELATGAAGSLSAPSGDRE